MSSRLKAVIFDMDGVLVDSEEFMRQAGIMMLEEKGVHAIREDFFPFTGMGENLFLSNVAQKYGLTLDIERDKARAYEIYGEITLGKLEPLPGVRDVIDICRERHLKTGIATNADKVKLLMNLERIQIPADSFSVMIYADMITNRKPHPEIYLSAARLLDVHPTECLVVEDTPSGLQSGKSAGMKCLALTTTYPAENLGMADWIIRDLAHIGTEQLNW